MQGCGGRPVAVDLQRAHPGPPRRGAQRRHADQPQPRARRGAHADSVPNLDIQENDVRCSHASTVGPVDEDQRYYLESRGVPPEVAERLIVLGFFDDIIERGPVPEVTPLLEREVRQRLDAALAATGGRRCLSPWCSARPTSWRRARRGGSTCRPPDRPGADRRRLLRRRRRLQPRGLLAGGGEVWADECQIECPRHGSTFDLRTGEPCSLPATQPVAVYDVEVDGDRRGGVAVSAGGSTSSRSGACTPRPAGARCCTAST